MHAFMHKDIHAYTIYVFVMIKGLKWQNLKLGELSIKSSKLKDNFGNFVKIF